METMNVKKGLILGLMKTNSTFVDCLLKSQMDNESETVMIAEDTLNAWLYANYKTIQAIETQSRQNPSIR